LVIVLTYDHPHRKTEDVVWRLMLAGRRPELVVLKWENRKQRRLLYAHRPAETGWACESVTSPRGLAESLDLPIHFTNEIDTLEDKLDRMSPEVVVIGGAGILPPPVVEKHNVLNVHPGLLPARRGLDVFKWSVYDCKQVGVTAHLCDKRTDLGYRLIEREVPVFANDTLHNFAMRQYEYELGTINPAIEMVLAGGGGEPVHPGETKPYKRMPRMMEAHLERRFEDYKRVYAG